MNVKNLFFHTLILSTIAGTAWLGAWQLQRREWKHALIQTIQSHLAIPATELPRRIDESWYWRKALASGKLNYAAKILIPQLMAPNDCRPNPVAEWGYQVFVPIMRNDGTVILYRQGWAPKNDPFFQLEENNHQILASGLEVIVRPFDTVSVFAPANQPKKNLWFRPDAKLYQAASALVQNYYLDAAHSLEIKCQALTSLWRGAPELPDNHLQYAITWFALAGMLTAYYICYQWKIRRGP